MNPYHQYTREWTDLLARGKQLPLGNLPPLKQITPAPGAPKALIFSPHPDDEVIIGGFPLRLRRELGWDVVNVAVTQGSNKARQKERWQELTACCRHIGFGLEQTRPDGLEGINLKARQEKPAQWRSAVTRIAEILQAHSPAAIFFPHAEDWNSSHIGTHRLVMDALAELGGGVRCVAVETEFWGAMSRPNLMIESSGADVADLIAALSFHVGEVQRNPYHVRLPAWMVDNVRRGGELVGGQGAAAPDFIFATLYRMTWWGGGSGQDLWAGGRAVGARDDLQKLFAHRPG